MRLVYVVGRVLFALIFIVAAPRHFTAEGITHAADLGVPLAALCVPLSGLMALAGGLSVASGYRAQWGAWLLVAFLVPVTMMMHGFWRLHDPQAVHIQQAMFIKNIALVGAALLLAQATPTLTVMTAVRAAGGDNQVGAVRGPALTWKTDVVKFFRKSAAA